MEPITTSLTGCARCHGEGHADLAFEPLEHPIEHEGVVIGTHWAACPTNGQPILMRIVPPVFACRR